MYLWYWLKYAHTVQLCSISSPIRHTCTVQVLLKSSLEHNIDDLFHVCMFACMMHNMLVSVLQ